MDVRSAGDVIGPSLKASNTKVQEGNSAKTALNWGRTRTPNGERSPVDPPQTPAIVHDLKAILGLTHLGLWAVQTKRAYVYASH